MLKYRVLVGVMALAAAGVASANGMYVGAGLGGVELQNKLVAEVTVPSSTGPVSGTATQTDHKLGLNGTLLAGYAWDTVDQYYLGLEGFFNAGTAQTRHSDSDSTDTLKLKVKDVYGLRVLPGFHITPQMVGYGILGVARGNMKLSDSGDDGSVSKHYNLNGYQLGLGAMTQVSHNVAVRADLIYTGYQHKTIESESEGGYSSSVKLEPSTMEFNVVGMYQFG